jgi:hypothetical protein
MSEGLDRRRVLRGVAVGTGLVWSAPAIKSLRLVRATGTSPPTSSSSTTAPTFETVPFTSRASKDLAVDESTHTAVWDVDMNLSNLGMSHVHVEFVYGGPTGTTIPIVSGTIAITPATGEFSGHLTSGLIDLAFAFQITMHFDVTSASGAYTGATGQASVIGPSEPHNDGTTGFDGTVNGTIAVPA